jgi:AAA family ATP:ADP antiporter
VTFAVQTALSRVALEKLGLGFAVGTPSMALALGSLGGVIAPGLESIMAARAGESILRGSLFRSGYELFYTPVSTRDKRAAKSLIDVGFDRIGDAVGAGLIAVALLLAPALQSRLLLATAIVCSAIALVAASRLNRGYLATLERSLLDRAMELQLPDVQDLTTRTVVLRTMRGPAMTSYGPAAEQTVVAPPPTMSDPVLADIAALRSRDRARVSRVLHREEPLPLALVAHVIPLLAWDAIAEEAVNALRKVSEERVGLMVDVLLDPNQPFAIRRRIPRSFSVCVSQRAVDGLLLGLDDLRFEVRFQCGRSLAAIHERNPLVRIDKDRVLAVVLREVDVSRPVWESHRLLDQVDEERTDRFMDGFVKSRAGQSLAHVFTLLSLVLPAEPLRIAYRGLQKNDDNLRGTALEYLEGVLPPEVRDHLFPFLDDRRGIARSKRPREDVLSDLVRLNQSLVFDIEDLRKRVKSEAAREDETQTGTGTEGRPQSGRATRSS